MSRDITKKVFNIMDKHHCVVTEKLGKECAKELSDWHSKQVAKAEQRGCAFAVGVIDGLHIGTEHSDTTDRLFKGMKNTIRDRFKLSTGVDPAPNYPINDVELESNYE